MDETKDHDFSDGIPTQPLWLSTMRTDRRPLNKPAHPGHRLDHSSNNNNLINNLITVWQPLDTLSWARGGPHHRSGPTNDDRTIDEIHDRTTQSAGQYQTAGPSAASATSFHAFH